MWSTCILTCASGVLRRWGSAIDCSLGYELGSNLDLHP